MAKYIWTASSNDGAYENRSYITFDNKEECYNDMRHHALEKMKWNTEYAEDFDDIMDDEYIGYSVKFYRNKIVHESYSGIYTYQIEEVIDLPTIPSIRTIYNDHYDEKKHCYCIDVYKHEDDEICDYEVVAEVYDNGFVKILNPTLCANPMVIQSINEVTQTLTETICGVTYNKVDLGRWKVITYDKDCNELNDRFATSKADAYRIANEILEENKTLSVVVGREILSFEKYGDAKCAFYETLSKE